LISGWEILEIIVGRLSRIVTFQETKVATMLVTDDTPEKLVLVMDPSYPKFKPLTLHGCIGPTILFTSILILIFIWARVRFFNDSQSWLFWLITAGVLIAAVSLIFIFISSLSVYRNEAKEATVSVDLDSQQAVRVEKLNSGETKQYALKFEHITRILVHGDDAGHRLTVTLESQNTQPLKVNSDVFINPSQMIEFGKKLGDLIKKPVLFKVTEAGKPVSEEIIQL
jgi:hypothetical protein